ncbi:hypothetical protein GQ44DRAFT_677841 [Phaeosphaeriaceae sp. PMI808]|nr:hypothetical protein GQ44DRAFT_677841 [Phaeosphaeriaceae sp. PMI808]
MYYQFWVTVLAIWIAYLARTSVACLLLQFDSTVRWRIVLYGFIVAQMAVPLSFDLAYFCRCRPLRAMWETLSEERTANFYLGSAAISDVAFAVMPMLFIWKLNKPRIERVIITILMALGLCAMVPVIIRSVNMARRDSAKDAMRERIFMTTMCRVEDFILIAAACAPFLKSPLERCMQRRFGVGNFYNVPLQLNSIHSCAKDGGNNSSSNMGPDGQNAVSPV